MYQPTSYKNRLSARNDEPDRGARILDAFFNPLDTSVRSIREAYVAITGDKHVTGKKENCDAHALREAVGMNTFSNVLGDAITRRMLREYQLPQYNLWRDLVDTRNVTSFRTQERTRIGGYGNLQVVAENDAYPALTSPTDEKATYALSKRGGTEAVSLEAIANDDAGAIARIPQKLAIAAARTLQDFVLDFLRTNPTIYDGVALFHLSHANLGSAQLSAAGVAAGRVALRNQTEYGTGKRLGLEPAVLWVPHDLEETAYNIFQRGTNNDRSFVESLPVQINVVPDWTDVNDWAMSADKAVLSGFELGFYNGNEEPELFVQDQPTQGSLFSNDQLIYKIRHIYSGAVTDFRPYYKSLVV